MIRKRGKFEVFVYSPAAGKKLYVGRFDRKGSVNEPGTARHAEATAEREFHKHGRTTIMTVAGWATIWQRDHGRPEETTRRHHANNLETFLSEFGDRRLDRITKAEAKRVAETRPHVAKTASAMFNDAIRYLEGYTGANPFQKLVVGGKGRQDITPLSESEVQELAHIALERWGPLSSFPAMIVFAAWTGMRPGEIAALRWTDLDFQEGLISVERQRRVDGMHLPKTKRTRTIVMPSEAARAVQSMPVRHVEWVFTTPNNVPYSKGNWGYYWRPVRDVWTAGLPASHWLKRRLELDPDDRLDFYEMRHMCASMLADRGCTARDIAQQLGNSAEVCERIYVHPFKDRVRARIRAAFEQPAQSDGRETGGTPPADSSISREIA